MTQYRVQIEIDGIVTADETGDHRSPWRALGDTLALAGYRLALPQVVIRDGWHQYTTEDGTVVRASRV